MAKKEPVNPFPRIEEIDAEMAPDHLDKDNSFIISSFTVQVGEDTFQRKLEVITVDTEEVLLPPASRIRLDDLDAFLSPDKPTL